VDRRQAPGYVFIAGGVGVTPLYSMLLTMREREDVRPVTLFYASATWDDVVFREELAELSETMPNLEVIHVLDQAPEGWTASRASSHRTYCDVTSPGSSALLQTRWRMR
jgi:predicted ferric reductase